MIATQAGMRGALRRAVFVVALTLLGACSGLQLDAARSLAGSGRDAFEGVGAGYRALGDQYREFNATVDIAEALNGRPPGRRVSAEQMQRLNAQLDVRVRAVNAFVTAYRALEALTAYDASGEMRRALQGLDAALGVGASALGGPAGGAVAAIGSELVQSFGELAAGEAQRRRVRDASRDIRERLQVFRSLHAREREEFVGLLSAAVNARFEAVLAWWLAGQLSMTPAVELMAQGSGMATLDGRTQPIRATNPNIARAGAAYIASRQAAAREAATESYDSVSDLMADLIDQHTRLEAGAPMDIGRIREVVARLREIVGRLQQAAGQRPAAR